jgi:hypothetical protein
MVIFHGYVSHNQMVYIYNPRPMVSNHMPNAWRVLSGLLKKHHHKVVDLAVAKLPSSYIMLHSCYIKIPPDSNLHFAKFGDVFLELKKPGVPFPRPSWWMMKSTPTCKAEAAESRRLVRQAG